MAKRSQGESQDFNITNFIIKQQIGVGKFGVVYRAIEKRSEQSVAIKIISKKTISKPDIYHQLNRQIVIHSRLKHPAICNLFAYFHDSNNVYLVLQYCPHGSLAPYVVAKQKFSDKKIASILLKLLNGLAYMHTRNVMHRDLKLQNILLDQNWNVKITDFGWTVHQVQPRNTFCGTMQYICPQMANKQLYNHSIDVYCLGIIIYELFYFRSPFRDVNQELTFQNIRMGKVVFHDDIRLVPDDVKELLLQLLSKDPTQRPKPADLFNHSFIRRQLYQEAVQDQRPEKQRLTEKIFNQFQKQLILQKQNKNEFNQNQREEHSQNVVVEQNKQDPEIKSANNKQEQNISNYMMEQKQKNNMNIEAVNQYIKKNVPSNIQNTEAASQVIE